MQWLKQLFNKLKSKIWLLRYSFNGFWRYGRLLRVGWIVRFRSPEVDFDEALKAGQSRMMEYFSEALGGLRVGYVKELRRLGFFSAVEQRIGLNVDVGSWGEIPAAQLNLLIDILEEIRRKPTELGNLLDDLLDMAKKAQAEGCSIAFLLAD